MAYLLTEWLFEHEKEVFSINLKKLFDFLFKKDRADSFLLGPSISTQSLKIVQEETKGELLMVERQRRSCYGSQD